MDECTGFFALSWVKNDIQNILLQVQQSFAVYLEKSDKPIPLQLCCKDLKVLENIYQLLEFNVSAILASELRQIILKIIAGNISKKKETITLIEKAIITLIENLENIATTKKEIDINILLLLNDLRTAQHKPLLSETALFSPNLSQGQETLITNSGEVKDVNITRVLDKIYRLYHFSITAILSDKDLATNFQYLIKVFDHLIKVSRGYPIVALWMVMRAVVEGIINESIIFTYSLKVILGDLDKLLTDIKQAGEITEATPFQISLLKNTLFYVATSDSFSTQITIVKESFQLSNTLPYLYATKKFEGKEALFAGLKYKVIGRIYQEIIQDLKNLILSLNIDSNSKLDQNWLKGILYNFDQLSQVMYFIGLSRINQNLLYIKSDLKAISTNEVHNFEQRLKGVAEELNLLLSNILKCQSNDVSLQKVGQKNLFNIDRLDKEISEVFNSEINQATQTIFHICRSEIAKIETYLVDYLHSKFDKEKIYKVPLLLSGIGRVFEFFNLRFLSWLIFSCNEFIKKKLLLSRNEKEQSNIDELAVIIAFLDYALEQLADGFRIDVIIAEKILPATKSLGFILDDDLLNKIYQNKVFEIKASTKNITKQQTNTEAVNIEAGKQGFGEDIDEEIIEIFIEEAEEVLETLQRLFTTWSTRNEDQESLTEIRRCFHTLKGSGRLVGAIAIGELAWSIENLLNQLLGKFIQCNNEIVKITQWTIEILPQLISSLINNNVNPIGIPHDMIRNFAFALAKQEKIDLPSSLNELLPRTTPSEVKQGEESSLIGVFTNELKGHLNVIQNFFTELKHGSRIISSSVLRALHTLRGSAHMAGVKNIATLITKTEILLKGLKENHRNVTRDIEECLVSVVTAIEKSIESNDNSNFFSIHNQLALEGNLNDLIDLYINIRAESNIEANEVTQTEDQCIIQESFSDVFKTEEIYLIINANELIELWQTQNLEEITLKSLILVLTLLIEKSRDLKIDDLEQFCNLLKQCYECELTNPFDKNPEFFSTLEKAHENLLEILDLIVIGHSYKVTDSVIISLMELINKHKQANIEVENVSNQQNKGLLSDITEDQGKISNLDDIDSELFLVFLEEARDIVDSTSIILQRWVKDFKYKEINDMLAIEELQRDLHTLKGGARMAGIYQVSELAHQLENIYEGISDGRMQPSEPMLNVLTESHDYLSYILEMLCDGHPCPTTDEVVNKIKRLLEAESKKHTVSKDSVTKSKAEDEKLQTGQQTDKTTPPVEESELFQIFLEEARDIVDSTSYILQRWISSYKNKGTNDLLAIEELQRDLHTLKGGARLAEVTQVSKLAHKLESVYEGICDNRIQITETLLHLLTKSHDFLSSILDSLFQGKQCPEVDSVIKEIDNYLFPGKISSSSIITTKAKQKKVKTTEKKSKKHSKISKEPSKIDFSKIENDVLVIFLEEAEELIEGIETNISSWRLEPNNESFANELKRLLHTLKGSAGVLGLDYFRQTCHDFESNLSVDCSNPKEVNKKFFTAVDKQFDVFNSLIAACKAHLTSKEDTHTKITTLEETQKERASSIGQKASQKVAASVQGSKVVQEMVRISSDQLESLVNLAGETSITQGRVEQQINDFSFTLTEITETVNRLKDLLRRLDIETETQILYQHERIGEQEDFDPLELDRYSSLHHLSRSLTESASDLLDLKDTLVDKIRATEFLLVQQGRVNSALQEGLMRTRMVPFMRLAPRLRRIVRQVSTELNKEVELEVINAEGEIDRTVLERMIAPLEHMLRNAVDHGIETPEKREVVGKTRVGRITLSLTREGGEIVLRLVDDGRGIDLKKVRDKAIENGLMTVDSDLSDNEVLQFIFRAGFSTASDVTQISGRGVGMDVVYSEIKQLGGNMKIHSTRRVGTQFTIRLPFTVSVSRALMVKVSDDIYAIPINHIEGIIRIPSHDLEKYLKQETPQFNYAGQSYRLQYLGFYVHGVTRTSAPSFDKPMPVLLVKGNESPIALQVDALVGSREIVVKSVGPQLSGISGISGATILGDGNVVIILDLLALIRAEKAGNYEASKPLHMDSDALTRDEKFKIPLVMVVDDSVTVRKVTTRLLERHGMDVVVAKDGLDAINLLNDVIPDLMLLDIEMPRMDGFEVATLVRHDQRLKHIPIIMVTSRGGKKHKNRAYSIGIDKYMGKPFQETELLDNIRELMALEWLETN